MHSQHSVPLFWCNLVNHAIPCEACRTQEQRSDSSASRQVSSQVEGSGGQAGVGTGVVDQDVKCAKALDCGVYTSLRKVHCSDVASNGNCLPSLRLNLSDNLADGKPRYPNHPGLIHCMVAERSKLSAPALLWNHQGQSPPASHRVGRKALQLLPQAPGLIQL